jgi:hypothetical protein
LREGFASGLCPGTVDGFVALAGFAAGTGAAFLSAAIKSITLVGCRFSHRIPIYALAPQLGIIMARNRVS